MNRAYYSDTIADFLERDDESILGALTNKSAFDITTEQRGAWQKQIHVMKQAVADYRGRGKIYFEHDIPRLGGRIDVLALIDGIVFIIEFKVGAERYEASAMQQAKDYALDMKHFHTTSHNATIAPVLVATEAPDNNVSAPISVSDNIVSSITVNGSTLGEALRRVLESVESGTLDAEEWEQGSYLPSPNIIEAAIKLYGGHSVREISGADAGAQNLAETSETIMKIIESAKKNSQKAICFLTGVPGAGKTLVGLDIAAPHAAKNKNEHAVFLSGNAPLVNVLCEALARDKIAREPNTTKGKARREAKTFIQNVHHFRDECIKDKKPPPEHVALYDEAQRAWNKKQTCNFMKRKKNMPNFDQSEPEFLISCLDRHKDWAVVVCLVGGGQEIKTGEAGIGGWISAITDKFNQWRVYVSPDLHDAEYAADEAIKKLPKDRLDTHETLHLNTSMRSFRSKHVSKLVKELLDIDIESAKSTLAEIGDKYPIMLTRNLHNAKTWIREQAQNSERYGLVVSSQAERLRPHAIDVRPRINPVYWFLNGKDDLRSSYYLEDVATEFEIQGLEVDWTCLVWDADLRYNDQKWEHWFFRGSNWQRIHKPENQIYHKNAYRVLLTRARQGMVIVVPEGVPEGNNSDDTRKKEYYDPTFKYLQEIGFAEIPENESTN